MDRRTLVPEQGNLQANGANIFETAAANIVQVLLTRLSLRN
jgi:hypothetical protein